MHEPSACLRAGLEETTTKQDPVFGLEHSYQLGWLIGEVSQALCSEAPLKQKARERLAKMLSRGRTILNARDHNKRNEQAAATTMQIFCSVDHTPCVPNTFKACATCRDNKWKVTP